MESKNKRIASAVLGTNDANISVWIGIGLRTC